MRAEEVFSNLRIIENEFCITRVYDLPIGENITPVRASETQASILLNNEDCNALFAQVVNPFDDLLLVCLLYTSDAADE